jgi:hypothetical protein
VITANDGHDRLARIKAAYDPENVFRLNPNIRRAAAQGPLEAAAPCCISPLPGEELARPAT